MTAKELSRLGDDEIRVRVAELCGMDVSICRTHHLRECCGRRRAPAYATSLDAMHEAESTLQGMDRHLYASHLTDLISPGRLDGYDPDKIGAPWLSWDGVAAMLHATARQRAIAFILTMEGGK